MLLRTSFYNLHMIAIIGKDLATSRQPKRGRLRRTVLSIWL